MERHKETAAHFVRRCETISGLPFGEIPRGEGQDAVRCILGRRGATLLVDGRNANYEEPRFLLVHLDEQEGQAAAHAAAWYDHGARPSGGRKTSMGTSAVRQYPDGSALWILGDMQDYRIV